MVVCTQGAPAASCLGVEQGSWPSLARAAPGRHRGCRPSVGLDLGHCVLQAALKRRDLSRPQFGRPKNAVPAWAQLWEGLPGCVASWQWQWQKSSHLEMGAWEAGQGQAQASTATQSQELARVGHTTAA